MRKLTLLTCALAASTMAFAQTNLALNKTAKASSVSDENAALIAENAVDGNQNTKWASNYDKTEKLGNTYDKDGQWIYVDLGTEMTVNTVKMFTDNQPASEFEIRVANEITEGNEKTAGTAVSTKLSSNADAKNIYKFDATKGRYVIINFISRATTWGYGINELEIYNIDYDNVTLKSFTVSKYGVYNSDGTAFNFLMYGTDGEEFKASDVTFYATDEATVEVKDGKLMVKASAAGTYEITAKAGTVELSQTVKLVEVQSATVPSDNADDVFAIYSNAYTVETAPAVMDKNWEKGYISADEISLGGENTDNAYFVDGVGSFGLNGGHPTTADYNSLKFDIYAFEDMTGTVELRNGRDVNGTRIMDGHTVVLQGGQWNTVEVSLSEALKNEVVNDETKNTTVGYIIWSFNEKGSNSIVLDNVYFSKTEATPVVSVIKSSATEWTLVGEAKDKKALEEAMNDENVTYYDITDLKLPEGISEISPANPNALIFVAKSKDDAEKMLTGTNNVIYKNGDLEYLFPVRQLIINDAYPTYSGHMVSSGEIGFKYTRNLTAGKYVTATLPASIDVPEGVKAYEFTDYKNNELTFTEVNTLTFRTPYVLYAEKDVEMVVTGTGDVLVKTNIPVGTGNVKFTSNESEFVATGAEWGLQNSGNTQSSDGQNQSIVFKKVVAPAVIGAFRAYFTGIDDSQAKAFTLKFVDSDATGITSVAAEATAAGKVYSIDGKFINATGSTENLAKGLYIVNGKKVIVR